MCAFEPIIWNYSGVAARRLCTVFNASQHILANFQEIWIASCPVQIHHRLNQFWPQWITFSIGASLTIWYYKRNEICFIFKCFLIISHHFLTIIKFWQEPILLPYWMIIINGLHCIWDVADHTKQTRPVRVYESKEMLTERNVKIYLFVFT